MAGTQQGGDHENSPKAQDPRRRGSILGSCDWGPAPPTCSAAVALRLILGQAPPGSSPRCRLCRSQIHPPPPPTMTQVQHEGRDQETWHLLLLPRRGLVQKLGPHPSGVGQQCEGVQPWGLAYLLLMEPWLPLAAVSGVDVGAVVQGSALARGDCWLPPRVRAVGCEAVVASDSEIHPPSGPVRGD
jgi:hypothetical protein